MRDIRTMNMTEGQKIESDTVMKRIGDIEYRNMGTLSKMSLFDEGKALIVGDGLRVEPSSGMTVNIPSGSVFQRFVDVIPCMQTSAQTVTLDAATGVARTDIVEAQIKVISDKTDYSQVATVASGSSIAISNEEIKRDIKYYLSARKQTNTTTPTAATAGTLTGTVAIAATIDLSEEYLLNLSDGEDGSFQEIDCRGATPEATTKTEIINAINAAVGRTMASAGAGDVIVLTGTGTGQTSYFEIKPPNTDADKDCLETILGVSAGGIYRYTYSGNNEWFKLAEIDVGTATTTITAALIRNVDRKDTWTGNTDDILVHEHLFQPNISEWTKYSSTVTYGLGDIAYIEDDQYVSLQAANLNKYPITNPDYWEIVPPFSDIMKDYQNALIKWPGIKDIDNYRDAGYQQWNFAGYYTKDSNSYKAYKVRLDGTIITGDTDLEDIFDVDGSDEYFLLDTLAPDSMGTRTLPDLRGKTVRAVDDSGSTNLTEAVGSVQEDAMQRITGDTGAGGIRPQTAAGNGAISVGNTNVASTFTSGGAASYKVSFDSDNSTSPNPAKTDDSETRMANYTVGVPHIIILLPV